MRCVLLNRFLSVWCCVYLWYPRFLMRCVLLNRTGDIRGKHNTTQKANDWATRTSLRTGDIRGKHNTTQKGNDWVKRTRVAQSFAFCVVLCLPLISPVLNEVRVAQPFTFCVVLCLPLIPPVLNDVLRSTHPITNGNIRCKHNTTQKANDWVRRTSLRTEDIRGKHNTRLLSVWCCVYLWYPRFLMRCVLLNRLLSVWCCVYLWYPRFLMRCVLLNRFLSEYTHLIQDRGYQG
jgi:hypothetical protein